MGARVSTWADGLIRLSALVGTIGLVIEVVVILIDVIGRFFGSPLTGAQDISQMSMVLIVFGGMALCDKIGGHVNVDLLENAMPRWMIWVGDFASAVIGAVIFIAGNLPNTSEIAPLLIVIRLEQFDYAGAAVVATIMLLLSFSLILLVNLIQASARRRFGDV